MPIKATPTLLSLTLRNPDILLILEAVSLYRDAKITERCELSEMSGEPPATARTQQELVRAPSQSTVKDINFPWEMKLPPLAASKARQGTKLDRQILRAQLIVSKLSSKCHQRSLPNLPSLPLRKTITLTDAQMHAVLDALAMLRTSRLKAQLADSSSTPPFDDEEEPEPDCGDCGAYAVEDVGRVLARFAIAILHRNHRSTYEKRPQ